MLGHVMPSFPYTLIGLGPFADQGCQIIFTKTAVTVYHPDGHPILSGWRDETGPRLCHFPLIAETTNPQDVAPVAAPRPTTVPPATAVIPRPLPAPVIAPTPAPVIASLPD